MHGPVRWETAYATVLEILAAQYLSKIPKKILLRGLFMLNQHFPKIFDHQASPSPCVVVADVQGIVLRFYVVIYVNIPWALNYNL